MHGLSVRRRRVGNWDLEAAGSLYDYDERPDALPDWSRMPTALAAAAPGRIADQSGTGWTTLRLARALARRRGAGAHLLELGIAGRPLPAAHARCATTERLAATAAPARASPHFAATRA